MDIKTRTAAVVHLDRLKHNLELTRDKYAANGAEIIAVLKGDAYGCGIAGVYPVFKDFGIKRYAVAIWEEGRDLRAAGAEDEEIIILGDTCPWQYEKLFEHRLIPAVFSLKTAEELSSMAAERVETLSVSIKVDTGMSRIGFPAGEEAADAACRIASLPGLKIHGMFTHFACADEDPSPSMDRQLKLFLDTAELIRKRGVNIPLLHTANSPATLLHPKTHLDAIRPGDILYGLNPVDNSLWRSMDFKEVMTWETYAAHVKTVPAGTSVGYGATFTTDKDMVIATVPVGFADGYRRHLSNKGCVYINGCKAPIIGRVCMDQFMVDASGVPGIKAGDRVELLGERFGILDMADMLDLNVDEVVTGISKRVPRIYTYER